MPSLSIWARNLRLGVDVQPLFGGRRTRPAEDWKRVDVDNTAVGPCFVLAGFSFRTAVGRRVSVLCSWCLWGLWMLVFGYQVNFVFQRVSWVGSELLQCSPSTDAEVIQTTSLSLSSGGGQGQDSRVLP